MENRMIQQYKNIYESMNFERGELFAALSNKYSFKSILYPGCNIHVTPSFYFPHVVYVDCADNAREFFEAEESAIIQFINENKKYKQSPYIQYIHQDFILPLPLRENEFDLLISLFAGGIAKSCFTYLRQGGYLLTNNHHHDANEAISSGHFKLAAVIQKKQKKYEFIETNLQHTEAEFADNTSKQLCKNNPSGGLQYKENETFYLLKKMKGASPSSRSRFTAVK